MFKKMLQLILAIVGLFVIAAIFTSVGAFIAMMNPPEMRLSKNSIMAMELSGIIMDSREFVETLVKYRKEDKVKGIIITINSPGGVVGPSQEIYTEIKRTSEEFKKPVYVYCSGLAASGAYYAAVGADKIFTTPGCTMGSIGVLMDLVNLEKLYQWAKIERYALTTGQYKNAGAEYKPLTKEQRELFQSLIDQVLGQFKKAVSEGRELDMAEVDRVADGRVFTGEQAVEQGFADEIGTFEDAKKELGEVTGLGKDPEIFRPRKHKGFYALFDEGADGIFKGLIRQALNLDLHATPLFLLPGASGF